MVPVTEQHSNTSTSPFAAQDNWKKAHDAVQRHVGLSQVRGTRAAANQLCRYKQQHGCSRDMTNVFSLPSTPPTPATPAHTGVQHAA